MVTPTGRFSGSPVKIAFGYVLFGVLWIITTDYLVLTYVEGSTRVTQYQTIKGWIFVALSTVLIYSLVLYSQRDLEQTNDRLDTAIQQTSILDRILRHNLRNACNVIQANADMLSGQVSGEQEVHLETIQTRNHNLIELSENSRQLRDIVLAEDLAKGPVNLTERIESQVDSIRGEYPDAEVDVDIPETLWAETNSRLDDVIYELLENAIEHNDTPQPRIRVTARSPRDEDGLTIEIADNGPGLPDIERKVLEKGFETQMTHSQGLGLWIARTLVVRLGGNFTIRDNTPRGTTVQLSLPVSSPPR